MRPIKILPLAILVLGCATANAKSTQAFTVRPTMLLQENEGWGTSLCWWANMCGRWSDEKVDSIVDWLVSPDGLNFNIFRYNIGGGDDPLNRHCVPHHMGERGGKGLRAEMEGFKDSTNGSYVWSRDAAQRKIMLKIRERRPDAIFEAFSNSCPYYMTYSGCVGGNDNAGKDNLRPEYYDEFAHYLVDVCKHYKEAYGIEFKTLDPFNEPMTDYWYRSGSQEGCHFDVASQWAFLRVLKPILDASGLRTVISASDETNTMTSAQVLEDYRSSGMLDMVAQWNTHTYSADSASRTRIAAMSRGAGKMLWMSETGGGGRGFAGNLNLAQRLIDDERQLRPDAWIDWQYVDEGDGEWSLVHANFHKQTFHKMKSYYVRQQVTRFIRQGYTFVESALSNTLAAVNPQRDTLVLVTINRDDEGKPMEARLEAVSPQPQVTGYVTTAHLQLAPYDGASVVHRPQRRGGGTAIRYHMPAQSILTLIIPLAGQGGKDGLNHHQ